MEKSEESLRPKRIAARKVLTYNINYHQVGYYEQRELQKALKNSLLEAEAAKNLTKNITNQANKVNNCDKKKENSSLKVIKCSSNEKKKDNLEVNKNKNLNKVIKKNIFLKNNTKNSSSLKSVSPLTKKINLCKSSSLCKKKVLSRNSKLTKNLTSKLPKEINKKLKNKSTELINKDHIFLLSSDEDDNLHVNENVKNETKNVDYSYLNEEELNNKLFKKNKKCKKSSFNTNDQVTDVFNCDKTINSTTEEFLNFLCFRQTDSVYNKKDLKNENLIEDKNLKKGSDSELTNQDNLKNNLKKNIVLDKFLNEKNLDFKQKFSTKTINSVNNCLDEDSTDNLGNFLSSLIDKLDNNFYEDCLDSDNNLINFDSKVDKTNLFNEKKFSSSSTSITNHSLSSNNSNLNMVSNKNLNSLPSSKNEKNCLVPSINSSKIKKEINDKQFDTFKCSKKTNGHSNGIHLNDEIDNLNKTQVKLESQINSPNSNKKFFSANSKSSKNRPPRKAKPNVSLYDFHIEFDDEENSSKKTQLTKVNKTNNQKQKTGPKKHNSNSKLFTIQTCIKNEIRKKLLQKSIKLSKKFSSKKNGTSNLNGNDKNDSINEKETKLNGKNPKITKSNTKNQIKLNNKSNQLKKNNLKNLNKNSETNKNIKKQPRTNHLKKKLRTTKKSRIIGKTKNKITKGELLKKSELLIRNLCKFRQYLDFKKQELKLLNIDHNELSTLNMMTKDLMNCFIDPNNFDIDIYDPLTVSGLMSSTFSENQSYKSLLSNELIANILSSLETTNDLIDKNSIDDFSNEEEEIWKSAPSSPI